MNIKLLRFCGLGKNEKTKLYASAFGMKEGEQNAAREALGLEINFANDALKCLDALRHFPVLIAS